MAKAFYHPELDVVRFLAFLAVFLSHGLPASSSSTFAGAMVRAFSVGLPLFFCLSAFLITKLLLLERDGTGSINLPKFYKRRLLRIWPLYLSMLAISALISALHHTLHITGLWYVAALFMFGNTIWWIRTTVTHLWSISVEGQFYVFWPAIVGRFSDRVLLFWALGMFLVANAVLARFGVIHAQQDSRVWMNTLVQSEFFAAGIFLALRWPHTASLTPFLRLMAFGFALGLWYSSTRYLHAFGNPGELALGPISLCAGYALAVLGCLLIMVAIQGTTGWPDSLIYLGKISYGLYVFHGISLTSGQHFLLRYGRFPSLLASFVMDVGLAALSYRFFEAPFLRLKQKFEVVHSRPLGI